MVVPESGEREFNRIGEPDPVTPFLRLEHLVKVLGRLSEHVGRYDSAGKFGLNKQKRLI